MQRFTAVGTLLYFFLCYYFHVVYSTVLLKLYYSVTRSVLLVTCRLQYCSSYSVLYGPFCKKDTVCTVGFNCSAFATLLQRYVTQCLRIIMCCLHAVCCTVIFLYCSVDALLYTLVRSFTFSPRHALLLTQAMCVCPILVHCCALLILSSIANLSCGSVPAHYTAANMLFALCSTAYSSNVYGDVPVQCSQLELQISTDTLYSCQYALHCCSVPLCYFTLP